MNERQRYRVWWQCIDCGSWHSTIFKAGCALVVPTPELMGAPCSAASTRRGLRDKNNPFCRLEQKGGFEQCTGFWAGSRLVFDGDRVGTDKHNWAEVYWDDEKGQWRAGDPLWWELKQGAVIVGNSYDPIPDDEDEEEPQNKDKQE